MNVLAFETCWAKNKASDISWSIFIQLSIKIIWSVSDHNLPKCARFFSVVTQTANSTKLWDLIICVTKLTKYNRYWKVKQSLNKPEQALRSLKLPDFKTIGNPYSFLLDAESNQEHGAAGRIMSMANSSDTIGNRRRHLPACIVVYQDNALRQSANAAYCQIHWKSTGLGS